MRGPLLTIAWAEWLHNRRDPRSLIVIAALPVVLLLLYGYGINYDLDHIPFAVYDLDGSKLSRDLINQFQQSRHFSLTEVVTQRSRLGDLLERGKVVFVLALPADLSRTVGAGRAATVQMVLNGADTTRANVALGYVEGALLDFSRKLGAEFARRQGVVSTPAFSVRPTILYNPGLESTRFIVPGLIALLLTILASLLTSTCIVREREWGSFETLVASPVRAYDILIGKMIPYVVIASVDVVLSVAAGKLVFGVSPVGSMGLLLGVSTLYLLASLAIGVLFSVVARTQRVAILAAMLATLLPTVLLSGFAFPIRSMPLVLQGISNVLPATHFLIIIRSIYLKGAGLAILWPRIAALAGFTILVLLIAAVRFRKRL